MNARRAIASWRAMATGVYAALVTPEWIAGRRFDTLLAPRDEGAYATAVPSDTSSDRSIVYAPSIALGIRASRWMIRHLSRLPRSPWRDTCLYQSVAECIMLRSLGVPATVVLGVRSTADATSSPPASSVASPLTSIAAHAWVDSPSSHVTGYVPLQPVRSAAQ